MTSRLSWITLVLSLIWACGSEERSQEVAAPGAGDMDAQSTVTGGAEPTVAGMEGESDSDVEPSGPNTPMGTPTTNPIEGLPISAECQGIDFEGLLARNVGDIDEDRRTKLNRPGAVQAGPLFEEGPLNAQLAGDLYVVDGRALGANEPALLGG